MPSFEASVKALSILGAVATFSWGAIQYTQIQRQQGAP